MEFPSLCRLFGLLILLADIVFIAVDIFVTNRDSQRKLEVAFQILDLLFSAYFCVEVSLRMIGLG